MSLRERSPEQILRERAARLARPLEGDAPAERRTMLLFGKAAERLAVDAREVRGIFRLHSLTPLPGAPAHVAGITSWRGRLLAILDLEVVLGVERSGLDDRVWVVALSAAGTSFGLLAGRIIGVQDVLPSAITEPEAGAPKLVTGVAPDAVLILDVLELERVLSSGGTK